MAGTEPTRYTFNDLTVWRTALPGIQNAVLPPSSDRPNPRLGDGKLFVSVFAPGCIYALEAATGEICWRRELPYLASACVELAAGLLLAKTSQTLYAVEPASGSIRWEFCPYGAEGESLYSEPVVDGRRLFIGDRAGCLHCLDLNSGETIWKRETSEALNRQVNATAAVTGELVITATNAALALAYGAEDGSLVWKADLDGPCTQHLFVVKDQVVVVTESLYFLAPGTGELQGLLRWPGFGAAFATGAASQVALIRRPSGDESGKYEKPDQCYRESETLLLFEGTQLVREIVCSAYASAMRFSSSTGLLYTSGLSGLDILNADTGQWSHTLRPEKQTSGYGLPEVVENRLYTVDGDGIVYALEHPHLDAK